MAVSTAPMGVVPLRISKIAGAPPHTMGEPGWASWWMAMPLRHSAACCTTEPRRVTGAAAPASGIETISAGTPARASSIRFCAPKSLQISGGEGQTSNTAWGFSARASCPPAKIASMSIMCCKVAYRKCSGYDRVWKRTAAPDTGGTDRRWPWGRRCIPPQWTARRTAAASRRLSQSAPGRAVCDGWCSSVSGSSTWTPEEPGSKWTASPP